MNKDSCCSSCSTCNHKYCAKKVSIFSILSDAQLEEILKLITRKSFAKGETLFSEGEAFNKLYIINEGSIKVFTYSKEGKEQILYILNEGDFLGDLSLLKKSIFNFNATALEETKLCTIEKDDFDILLKNNSDINLKVLEYAHDRIVTLEGLVQTLTTKDIDTRLATLLLNFSKSFGIKTDGGIEITFPLSREDMANYIGVTRETISRKLSHFTDLQIIEVIENKKILIKDINALRDYV